MALTANLDACVGRVAAYFRTQALGLSADPLLRKYAWSLIAAHGIVILFFATTGVLYNLTDAIEPLCWPQFQECWQYRLHGTRDVISVLGVLTVVLAASCWALARNAWRLFWALFLLSALSIAAVVALDYRLKSNELYMVFWLDGAFLFWRARRWTIPLTLVSFYFWAGRLKLNSEWLSGSTLYSDLYFIPEAYVPVVCAYVVFLEMVAIWGLLARNRTMVAFTLAQLAIFHIESLSQIHWYYPALMASMLSWFLFSLGTVTTDTSLRKFASGNAPRPSYAFMALFGAFQLTPALLNSSDGTLSGEGRLLALHMFESKQQCAITATIRWTSSTESHDLKMRSLPPRTVCDPIVYYDRAKNMCRNLPAGAQLDLVMDVRRSTEKQFHRIISTTNFCEVKKPYSILGRNSWLIRMR